MKFLLDKNSRFPPAQDADEHGIVAVGGDLSTTRLIEAYTLGIFPWPHPDLPLLWFCPDPRFVLEPKKVIVSQSLKKAMRNTKLVIKADCNFLSVMNNCKNIRRAGQSGTWITDEMIDAYHELHQQGLAHSIEAYDGSFLVGGLYGVSLGRIFFGESMFSLKPNASKICFLMLAAHLIDWNFLLIDCQSHTDNLARLGAKLIVRDSFLALLKNGLTKPTLNHPWHLSLSPKEALKRFMR